MDEIEIFDALRRSAAAESAFVERFHEYARRHAHNCVSPALRAYVDPSYVANASLNLTLDAVKDGEVAHDKAKGFLAGVIENKISERLKKAGAAKRSLEKQVALDENSVQAALKSPEMEAICQETLSELAGLLVDDGNPTNSLIGVLAFLEGFKGSEIHAVLNAASLVKETHLERRELRTIQNIIHDTRIQLREHYRLDRQSGESSEP